MRRKLIYPHRSVRSIPFTAGRVTVAVLIAMALTTGIYWFRAVLLEEHNRITAALLDVSGIPADGSERVDIFKPIGSADVITTPVFSPNQQLPRVTVLFAGVFLALIVVHRKVPMARSFVVFLVVILLVTAVIIFIWPETGITSAEFSQIWLRQAVLIWFVLPWISACLLVVLQHNLLLGVAWAVVMQAYGFVWSAIRLAFCLGVLHFSGLLLMPLLWFTLGLLAEALYIVVFLSISTRVAGLRAWGRRASWQF